jgi:hypothetical protein
LLFCILTGNSYGRWQESSRKSHRANLSGRRIHLDESFDVGEDTGTPVIDEYDAKMPFKFTGTLEKVQIKLGPNELTPQQRGELEQLKRDFALAVQ